MNLDHYKSLLLAQERELIARRARTGSENGSLEMARQAI